MGEVFLGADTDGREFAFKILRPDLTADPAAVARFLQERSILVRMRHPNLVGVYDLVAEGDTVGIVMDYVPGGDLRRLLTEQGPLLPSEVARIGAGIASGLAMVHEAAVVHRDVKPENVLLDDTEMPPVPRLSDFGFSRLISSTDTGRSTLMVGTPLYVAPELVDGAEPAPAVDLYALGIVLYEMCCGVTPYAGGSMLTVLRRHAEMTPGRPEGIPDQLWDMISWLLAKSPRSRPQSARQVATVLEALSADLRGAPVAPRRTEPPAPLSSLHDHMTQGVAPVSIRPVAGVIPAPRRRRRLAVAGVALTGLLLAGGWVGMRSDDDGATAAPPPSAAPTVTSGTSSSASSEPVPTSSPTDTPSPTSDPSAAAGPAPKLVGLSLADAAGVLPPAVKLTSTDTVDEDATDGTVLTQSPAAGAPMDGAVSVTVARQPVLTYLDSMSPATGGWDDQRASALSGKIYPHSVSSSVSSCYTGDRVEYNLSRGYRKLVATVGLDDNSPDDSLVMQLEIFADGRKVSATKVVYGKPIPLTVDVTGVLRLRVQWQPVAGGCRTDALVLGDGRLLGLPGEVPEPSVSPTE